MIVNLLSFMLPKWHMQQFLYVIVLRGELNVFKNISFSIFRTDINEAGEYKNRL